MIRTSAPGKCILLGEHAVLYGQPGLVTTLDLRTTVEVNDAPDIRITSTKYPEPFSITRNEFIDLWRRIDRMQHNGKPDEQKKELEKTRSEKHWNYYPLIYVIGNVLQDHARMSDLHSGFHVHINSDVLSNLGSSSSVYAALALAFYKKVDPQKYYYTIHTENETRKGDMLAHGGNVSGIDSFAVSWGGTGVLDPTLGFGFRISNAKPLTLLVIDSGEDSGTFGPVRHVRNLYEQNPTRIRSLMNQLGDITRAGIDAYKRYTESSDKEKVLEAYQHIGASIDAYYKILRNINPPDGISTQRLDEIVALATENHLPAKPTGSWGGGCCIVLPPKEYQNDETALAHYCSLFDAKGYRAFPVRTSVEGVRPEKNSN